MQKIQTFANFQCFCQILKVERKSFLMMYHLSYLDIKHGIKFSGGEGGKIDPPPNISWFASTPTGIGLMWMNLNDKAWRTDHRQDNNCGRCSYLIFNLVYLFFLGKVIMQGKLIAVANTLRTYWNQLSLGVICKQEYMHQCSFSIRGG